MRRELAAALPRPLRWILAAYLALATLYALATPPFEVSDEPLHVAFAQHLAEGGALPVQQPNISIAQAPWQQEGSQPPLYYALLAVLAQPFDRSDFAVAWRFNPHSRQGRADAFDNFNQMLHPAAQPLHGAMLAWTVLRFVGVVCGAFVVVAAWMLASLLTPDRRVAALAAALVAFNPMFVHIMASVNNDTLAAALVSWAIVLGARQLTSDITLRRSLLLGLLLGAAALTKVSGLTAAAIIPAAIGVRMMFDGRRPKTRDGGHVSSVVCRPSSSSVVAHVAAIALPVLVIDGWWYLRNVQLYGDVTGAYRMAMVAGLRATPPTALQLLGEWEGFYMAYWGLFGAVNIALPTPIYDALEVLLALGGIGLALAVRSIRIHLGVAALCAALLGVTFAALVKWTTWTLASQGRLLFPVIAAISALWAAGLVQLLDAAPVRENVRSRIVAGLCIALAVLSLGAHLFAVQRAYALPKRLPASSGAPQDITPVELTFEKCVRWIGYRVNTPNGRVGEDRTLDVTLYLQALAPIERNATLFVRVLQLPASAPTAVAFYKSPGGGGMYAMADWRADEIIVERVRIRLPDDFSLRGSNVPQLVQSALAIDVGVIDGDGRFLEATNAAGHAVGRPNFPVAGFSPQAASSNTVYSSPKSPLARFERADLLTADVTRTADAVTATLRWSASGDFGEEYTVFVHVYAGDTLIAQADGPTAGGDFATRWWRVGDAIDDVRHIALPPDAPSGPLTMRVGLYRPQGDFARMPGVDASGAPLPDAAARLMVPAAPETKGQPSSVAARNGHPRAAILSGVAVASTAHGVLNWPHSRRMPGVPHQGVRITIFKVAS